MSVRPLCLREREEIRVRVERGESFAEIGGALLRDPSTISREVARNGGRTAYRACAAEERARCERRRPKVPKLRSDRALAGVVSAFLEDGYSPAAISARLRTTGGPTVSHEAIYQALYAPPRCSWLTVRPRKCLRTHRASRRHRRPATDRRRPMDLGDFRPIHDRPTAAGDRSEVGHWEGDLIMGAFARSAVITLVERVTRFTILGHIAGPRRRSEEVIARLIATFEAMPSQLAGTLTWDRGKEMCPWIQLEKKTPLEVYFCDAHSPWQRPSNEHTNRTLRFWLPKKTDLSVHTVEDLDRIARILNDHPRRQLAWQSPAQLYAEACRALTD